MKLLLFLVFALPCWATWTAVAKNSHTCSNATNTCNLTVTSTGTNHVILIGVHYVSSGGQLTISSVSGGGSYTAPAGCASYLASQIIGAACAYTLASTSGATTITVNLSANVSNAWDIDAREYSTTSTAAFDVVGTSQPASSATPAGVTLSLTGTNDVIFQLATTVNAVTAVNSPWSATLETQNGNGYADSINTGSGTAPTWTCSSSSLSVMAAIAIKEAAGADQLMSAMNKPTNTPIFQPIGILVYFRRRRDYIRAWIQRRLRKPCLLDWMHPDGSPVFEEAPKELVKIYKQEHGG